MTADRLLFVDEAGHAGANYLDVHQPFHVAAAWLVVPNGVRRVDVALEKIGPPSEERKGSRVLKNDNGVRRVVRFLEAMGQAGAIPFFVVMERRFAVAGKFVEVFLDPLTNPGATWLPTIDPERRRKLAERLGDTLPAALLDRFAAAYRAPSEPEFSAIVAEAEGVLAGMGDPELKLVASSLAVARNLVAEIVEYETYQDETTKHAQWAALNVPALGHLLRMVDRLVDGAGVTYDVVHDENVQFDVPFKRVVASYSGPGAEKVDVTLADGRPFRGIYRNLATFRLESSTSMPGLRAADVLAAAVAKVAKEAVQPTHPRTRNMLDLARLTMPGLFYEPTQPQLAGFYGHDRTLTKLLAAAFETAPE
jgi:hypothetical protein